jgi:negative regulator of genetic competence, sporulation and motility
MNIQKEPSGSLRIDLTANELQNFQLTYQLLDYNTPKTRQFFHRLLENAGNITDFPKGNGKLLIEVFPAPKQGCTVYFTRLLKKQKRYKRKPPAIYIFPDSESLLTAVEHLQNTPKVKSELYRIEQKYYLILQEQSPGILTEYGERLTFSRPTLSHIREHGNLLASPLAVQTILTGLGQI